MSKLVRITTVSKSLKYLLRGQYKFMSEHGFEVIGVSSNGKELEDVKAEEEIRIVPIEMSRKITPFKDLSSLYRLYKFLKKEKPFIVHTHTPKAGTIGMIAARLAGVPHRLHTVAGLPLMVTTGIKRTLLNWVEKATCSCATKVYPNSSGLYDFILKNKYAKEDKLKVIGNGSSNGIDTTYFRPGLVSMEQKNKLKQDMGIHSNDFVFIFVGRLVGDKGINELVAAFKKLKVINLQFSDNSVNSGHGNDAATTSQNFPVTGNHSPTTSSDPGQATQVETIGNRQLTTVNSQPTTHNPEPITSSEPIHADNLTKAHTNPKLKTSNLEPQTRNSKPETTNHPFDYAQGDTTDNRQPIRLLLVGPFEPELDPLNKETLEEINTNPDIISTGFQHDVRPYFAMADALVFPSYREGFPNVVMQAGAMELPSIVSDINGCNEIIIDGENGIIIPPKNVEALSNAMLKLLNDKEYYNHLKENSRRMIAGRYEQHQVWEAILAEYKSLEENR